MQKIDKAILSPAENQNEESLSDRLANLKKKCDSKLEKDVLDAIIKLKLPLPDKAQETCFIDGVPITKAFFCYFFYSPNKYIFVEGPPHAPENIKEEDRKKKSPWDGLSHSFSDFFLMYVKKMNGSSIELLCIIKITFPYRL